MIKDRARGWNSPRVACFLVILVVGAIQVFSDVSDVQHTRNPGKRIAKQSSTFQKKHPVRKRFHSAVRFMFVVGLEGTGHHLMGALINKSPATQTLKDMGIHPNLTLALGLSLADDNTFMGLLNAHCKTTDNLRAVRPYRHNKGGASSVFQSGRLGGNRLQGTGTAPRQPPSRNDGEPRVKPTWERRRLQAPMSAVGPNVNELLNKVVQNLQEINQLAEQQALDTATTMAINTWEMKTVKGFSRVGQISYPNQKGECRKLNYPNLDLWYQACDMAHVDCDHVYIYRDPYAVLKSTSRREMNPNVLGAIHLYISQLHIMFAQLSTHPQRTIGCWGVLEAEATRQEVWAPIQQVFGWIDQDDFDQVFEELYQPPSNITAKQMREISPPKFQPYLQSFFRAHENLIDLCREQVATHTPDH